MVFKGQRIRIRADGSQLLFLRGLGRRSKKIRGLSIRYKNGSFNIKLDGWSESVHENLTDYVSARLFEKRTCSNSD